MSDVFQNRFDPGNENLSTRIVAFDATSITFDDGHKEGLFPPCDDGRGKEPGLFRGFVPRDLALIQRDYDRWLESHEVWREVYSGVFPATGTVRKNP